MCRFIYVGSLFIYVGLFMWALYSVPLIFVSVFRPVPYCFDYCIVVIEFKIRERDTSSFILS